MEQKLVQQMTHKLKSMAELFPEIESDDFDRLNDLLSNNELVSNIILSDFLPIIEGANPKYLRIFGELCLSHNYHNLANLLIKYCFSQNLIQTDRESEWNLLYTTLKLIAHFKLDMYIDAEIESERVKLYFDIYAFSVNINKIPSSDSLEILRLLHALYARKIIDESSSTAPEKQAIFISKYNQIVSIIRTMDKERLRQSRWARLYASEDLEYSSETKSLFQGKAKDAAQFDDMLWKDYNILLIPAFGEIKIDKETIKISNEGKGCILNPMLEIWHDSNKVVEISTIDLVPAGKVCHFKLKIKDIKTLNSLNPNNRLVSLHLLFDKFNNNTSFRLTRSMEIRDLLENLPISISTETLHIQNRQYFTNFKQKKKVIDLLLACLSIRDQNSRQTIINELHDDIRNNVARSPVDRVEVMNLVNACLNYDNGLEEVIEVVRFFEGNSIAMQTLDDFFQSLIVD